MYSGITNGIFKVTSLSRTNNLLNYTVKLTGLLCEGLSVGASVAIDGVCQTVVAIDGVHISFQAMEETLNKTTLGQLKINDQVSVERSLAYGDEIGGHEVSGHVFGTAEIIKNHLVDGCANLTIKCNDQWMKYILPKGFIAVDGSSLTIGATNSQNATFNLHLIPETLRVTNFANKKLGDKVNIEVDYKTKTIVDTVERVISEKISKGTLQVIS